MAYLGSARRDGESGLSGKSLNLRPAHHAIALQPSTQTGLVICSCNENRGQEILI